MSRAQSSPLPLINRVSLVTQIIIGFAAATCIAKGEVDQPFLEVG